MEIYEIVKKLTGNIIPIEETTADNLRFENLQAVTELVDKLVADINRVAMMKTSSAYSVKRAGEFADKFLTRMGIVE